MEEWQRVTVLFDVEGRSAIMAAKKLSHQLRYRTESGKDGCGISLDKLDRFHELYQDVWNRLTRGWRV